MLGKFYNFVPGRQTFVASCLLFCTATPFQKECTLKGKNLLPRGANSLLLEYTPFQRGGKQILTRLSSPKYIYIYICLCVLRNVKSIQFRNDPAQSRNSHFVAQILEFSLYMCKVRIRTK